MLIEAQYLSSATWWQVIALETSSRATEYPMFGSQQGQVETEKLRAYLQPEREITALASG